MCVDAVGVYPPQGSVRSHAHYESTGFFSVPNTHSQLDYLSTEMCFKGIPVHVPYMLGLTG